MAGELVAICRHTWTSSRMRRKPDLWECLRRKMSKGQNLTSDSITDPKRRLRVGFSSVAIMADDNEFKEEVAGVIIPFDPMRKKKKKKVVIHGPANDSVDTLAGKTERLSVVVWLMSRI